MSRYAPTSPSRACRLRVMPLVAGLRCSAVLAIGGAPVFVMGAAFLVCSERVGAQANTSSLDSAFDAGSAAELRRLIEFARTSGLPTAPLISRMQQGAARRVPGDRVVALVRAHADSMRAARVALGVPSTADELDAGATALRAGATQAVLRRVRTSRAPGHATTALVILTDLLARGIAAGDASDAIASLAEQAPDSTLLSLQAAVARDGEIRSPNRFRALVERIARASPRPPRAPIPDALPPSGEGATTRTDTRTELRAHASPGSGGGPLVPNEYRRARVDDTRHWQRSLSLSTLDSHSDRSSRALAVETRIPISLSPAWHLIPLGALRLADESNRWSAGLAVARELPFITPFDARVFLSSELRSSVATSRGELPLAPPLAQAVPSRRSADVTFRLGSELSRRIGPIRVASSFAVGHDRYSRLENAFVDVPDEAPIDTQTPRPDTLSRGTRRELRPVWHALASTSLRGTVSLHRGPLLLEGGFVRRLTVPRSLGDSLGRPPLSLFTLGAEGRLAPWATLVAQWASRDPARVLGAPALSDARLRVGVRFVDGARPRPAAPRPAARPDASRPASVSVVVLSRSDRGAIVRVRVDAPHAETVEIEGDLSQWAPTALHRESGGAFVGDFTVASGIVRLRVRIDGGTWTTPSGVPTQHEDFGDETAVFVLSDVGAS